MYLSNYFLPLLKETPSEAQIVSHRLMLRAGMIKQTSAGIYAWLPLGLKIMKKIENVVREGQNEAGAVEVLIPTLQSAEIWQKSGRYDDYGKEMLRIKDRHDRDLLYGPTAEEVVTDIFRSYVKSYKDLPLHLYNIQWKFRDEIRPRFGVMRGREFLMKDNYSFDLDYEGALHSYQKMFLAYLKTFARLGIQAMPLRADTGPIGGDLSHEFVILAETGESQVFCDKNLLDICRAAKDIPFDPKNVSAFYDEWSAKYAASDDMHVAEKCPLKDDQLMTARGIEVGHIFYFGTKYSEPLGAFITNQEGQQVAAQMGSYGIGVSRLVAAIIEASHDEHGIIWPEAVAPFDAVLINLKPQDEKVSEICTALYESMTAKGADLLYDNLAENPGSKFARADLIGVPWQIILGPKGLENGEVEVKNRKSGQRFQIALDKVKGMSLLDLISSL